MLKFPWVMVLLLYPFFVFAEDTFPLPPPASTLQEALQGVQLDHWNPEQIHPVITSLLATNTWSDHSKTLSSWLTQSSSPEEISNQGWGIISNLQRWCELLDAQSTRLQIEPDTISWVLNDDALSTCFFETLSDKDHVPTAMKLLESFHQADPSHFPKYNALAVAMALVWDQPPSRRPHLQVDESNLPPTKSSVLERYKFWIDSDERHLCDYELFKLTPEHLKFVVDATATLDELRWAQTNVRFTKGNFGSAFSYINYDLNRFNNGIYNWPGGTYSLQEIKKRGGICVDQAYFAAMSGKANGIPTLYFEGQGRRGGHAWFGYMKNMDRWDMDCGRYQYDKYATGQATDHQTGEPISDHDIAFLAESFHLLPNFKNSKRHFRQAQLFQKQGNVDSALEALAPCISMAPLNLDAWNLKTELLEEKHDDKALSNHLNAMAQQFLRYPDIKTECQTKLAELARDKGDAKAAAALDAQVIRENRNKRHDLSAEVYERQLQECYEKKEFQKARTILHDAVMKMPAESGTVFKLAHEFTTQCLQHGHADEAVRGLTDFKYRMKYDSTIGNQVEALLQESRKTLREQQTRR